MDWQITIKKVTNGYILSIPEEEDTVSENETVINVKESVIEEDEYKNGGNREAMTKVLTEIADYFGFHHEKYNKNNLKISWDEKGSKVYDEDE